jgi:soluble P-type ATPase
MSLDVAVPGREPLRLRHLLLDVNGTLTLRGALLPGVAERLGKLAGDLEIRLLTADTFGTLDTVRRDLAGVPAERVTAGAEKAAVAAGLGPSSCAAIGNGANDTAMLTVAGLGIAVLGPEGASPRTLLAADVVCASITDALDLLADPRLLTATLRP